MGSPDPVAAPAVEGGEPFDVAVFWWDGAEDLPDYPATAHPLTYGVNWGDGSSSTYTESTFSHDYVYSTYPQSPAFTLTAWNDEGTVGTAVGGTTVDTPGGSPQLQMNAPSTAIEGDDVSFTATFTDPNQGPNDSDKGADSYFIFWGDGSESKSTVGSVMPNWTFDHTYEYADDFTITAVSGFGEEFPTEWVGSPAYVTQTMQSIDVSVQTPTVTAVGDTTATVLGDTYTLSLGFTQSTSLGNWHHPLYWSVVWGDGTSDDYYMARDDGSVPTPTHVYTTASTSGTEYNVDVTAYTDEGSYTATIQPQVLVAQAEMQIVDADGTTLDTADQHTMGAYVSDDPNDQATSLASADSELVEMEILPLPSAVGGTFTLSFPSDFTAWADPEKDTQIQSGQTYDATTSHTFYAAGAGISSQMAADKFSISWAANALFVALADFAAANGVMPSGPRDVPAYGNYKYTLGGAVEAQNGASPWTITGGTEGSRKAGSVVVAWNQPLNGATAGWNGQIQYNYKNYHSKVASINVVNVIVGTAPSFTPKPATQIFNGNRMVVEAGNPNAAPPVPGMAWSAEVTLNGPNRNQGVTQIQIGFIQEITQFSLSGTYVAGNKWVSSEEIAQGTGPVWDQRTDMGHQKPWYATFNGAQNGLKYQSIFTPPNANSNSVTLNQADSPAGGPPLQNNTGQDLTHMQLQYSITDYVCAETLDAVNGAPLIYVEEASASWTFNGSGAIGKWPQYKWIPDNNPQVTGPPNGVWTPITSGATPPIVGVNFDSRGNRGKFVAP